MAVGLGAAVLIYTFGSTELYVQKINLVAEFDMVYAYLSAYVFARMIFHLNFAPMAWKGRIMLGSSGNLRANPMIYKMIGENAMPNAIVVNEEGDIGSYCRANRSLTHFVENSLHYKN